VIRHDVTQGTPEWLALRAGIPTASEFDNIITPGGKPCKGERTGRYLHTLLAERIMGHPVLEVVTTWMDRGSALEAEAVAYYEGQRDLDTERIGFLTNDERTIGASPDRFVGADGLLEIKVPKEHTHVGYLLTESVDAAYYPQVQGQLWISERKWLDIMGYHPEMPPAIIHVERDEAYIAQLASAVESFSRDLERMTADLKGRGWIR
jgi:hypothetical protein